MKLRALSAMGLIVLPLAAPAQDPPQAFQLHGFAAVNPITTTGNNFFGKTANSMSLEFWELGLNASWRPNTELLLSAQVTSRLAGEEDDGAPRLDYGLLSYTFLNNKDNRAGLRVGRVLNPLGLYNETRDVAFTRNSILLPQSIYFDRTRDIALSGDGVQLFTHHSTDIGDFSLQLNAGLPRTDDSGRGERALLGPRASGELSPEPSVNLRLLYDRNGGRIRLALSAASSNFEYDQAERFDTVSDGDVEFRYLFLSAQYNAEKFTLTTELGPRVFKTSGLGIPDTNTTGESFYIEGLYRFRPSWEVFVRYDTLFTDRRDRQGNAFARRDPLGRPAYTRFAKDLTAGLTWRINRSALIRAEYHYVDGTAWLPLADNDPNALERYWSIFALQFALRF